MTCSDWVITVPQTVEWNSYLRELKDAAERDLTLNFRVPFIPKALKAGDRCFVVYKGFVQGWLEVIGWVTYPESWKCSTTGRQWAAGKYVQRKAPLHLLKEPIPMRGFQGIRRLLVQVDG